MKKDLFLKVFLTIVALLLSANLVFQFLSSSPSYGSKPVQYQYKVISAETFVSIAAAEDSLNKNGQEGWELVTLTSNGWLIFKKVK